MKQDGYVYELLAADYSPVALVVLSRDGTVRHLNHTMALLLGPTGTFLQGHVLAEFAPAVYEIVRPLLDEVFRWGRPRRFAGLSLPFPERTAREQTWDASCAPLPPDPTVSSPEIVALWLWPEDVATAASRKTIEALRANLHEALPPEIPGYDLAAALVPSEPGAVLGGDTYDVAALGAGRWALLMADVAGRGPAAAARAVMIRHSIRVLVASYPPARVLDQVSGLLLADTSFTGFVTAFLGILDTGSGTLTYVVAGHDPAFLLRGASGEVEELAGAGALPLGVDDQTPYEDQVTALTRKDTLLLYTDGLTDTRREREFFDHERVRACLRRHGDLPAAALVATLLAEAEEWAGEAAIRDDTALLAVCGNDASGQ